jgi:hypothetical protein
LGGRIRLLNQVAHIYRGFWARFTDIANILSIYEAAGFVKTMSNGYQLHTPEAVFTALRQGASTVFNPYSARPFFFLIPMNIQPAIMSQRKTFAETLIEPAEKSLSILFYIAL